MMQTKTFKDECDKCKKMKVCKGYKGLVLCDECRKEESDKLPEIIVGELDEQTRFDF